MNDRIDWSGLLTENATCQCVENFVTREIGFNELVGSLKGDKKTFVRKWSKKVGTENFRDRARKACARYRGDY